MPRKRALLSLRALNSVKKVFGAYIAASLMMPTPASSSVVDGTAVTLTGRFRGSAGSFWAVTVTGGSSIEAAGACWARAEAAPATHSSRGVKTRPDRCLERTSTGVGIRGLSHKHFVRFGRLPRLRHAPAPAGHPALSLPHAE